MDDPGPLRRAVMAGDLAEVRRLVAEGAIPRGWEGFYREASFPISMAEDRGLSEIAEFLRAVRPPERHPGGVDPDDPLREAVARGDRDALLAAPDPVTPRDDRGWLLRVAVDEDRADMVEFLLGLGLDPDARVSVGGGEFSWGMPLYECVRGGKPAMAARLLRGGADPNGQVYAGGTPLSEAYGQRDEAMIELLIRHGGKPNPSMAGLYRRKDLALRLLAEHRDERLPDDGFSSGTVAEQLVGAAARGGDPEILALGMARVDWPDGDPRWYAGLGASLEFWNHWIGPWCHLEWDRTGYLTCFREILARLGPPVRTARFGAGVLHRICVMGSHVQDSERVAFARAALDAGAPLEIRDQLVESTPLGWACRAGHADLVQLFLERGADPVEAETPEWARPLAWARKKGWTEIAAMIESYISRKSGFRAG